MTHHVDIEEIKSALEAFRAKAGKADELEIQMKGLKGRLEKMEIEAARPQLTDAGPTHYTEDQREHTRVFEALLREPLSQQKRADLVNMETRVASGLTGPAGGYAVPEEILAPLQKRIKDKSAMRSLANVVPVSSSDSKMLVSKNGATSGWAGETDTRSATEEPVLYEAAPTSGTCYTLMTATEELIMDSAFPVQEWFLESASDEIAQAQDVAFVSGDGTKKPTGFLDATPESAGDLDSPARTDGALQYFPTGIAADFPEDRLGSPAGNPGDILFNLVYGVRTGYRKNGVWQMNSTVAGTIRKWRDADGRSLWTDGLAQGQPALLAGYPVAINEQMPAIGANAFPLAFGDWRKGYLITDQGGLRLTIDDNISTPGQVRFYLRGRVGGCVLDDNAIKLIKVAVS